MESMPRGGSTHFGSTWTAVRSPSQSEPVSETRADGPGAEPKVSVSEHSPAGDPLPEELPSEDPLVAVSEQAGLAPPDETDDEAAETTEPLDDAAESPILRPFPEREGT